MLSNETFTSFLMFGPTGLDPARITDANRYNDLPGDGRVAVEILASFTVDDAITEPVDGRSVANSCDLVGSKSKVYEWESIADGDNVLGLIDEQPDVIGGGTLEGTIIYYVDADDTDLIMLCDDSYIIPAARI